MMDAVTIDNENRTENRDDGFGFSASHSHL